MVDYQEANEELFNAGHGSRGWVVLVLPRCLNTNSCLRRIVKEVLKAYIVILDLYFRISFCQ